MSGEPVIVWVVTLVLLLPVVLAMPIAMSPDVFLLLVVTPCVRSLYILRMVKVSLLKVLAFLMTVLVLVVVVLEVSTT